MSVESSTSLLELLRRYRLLEPAQLGEAERTLVPRFGEAKALGGELLKRGWLTAFQANQLLQGRAQDLMLGSYVLLERLGEGGMGAVYKARHAKLGRTVAVKVIRKERLAKGDAVRRFQREIRAAAQLNHPNIVRAYDADEVDGTHLLAMELVEGAIDLAKLVKERGPLPVVEACEYIRQAALGLQHAFERGMVHRDIKPQNLLMTNLAPRESREAKFGVVKILDMGLARLGDDDKGENSTSTLTQEGAVMGTLDYIAPEQARDSHTVDIRADLYSLGCTLFFLLTGRVPFPGGTAAQKLMKHQLDAPPGVQSIRPEVPTGVASIVAKLMAKRAEDRFQTPAELAQALANPTVTVATGSPSVAGGRGIATPARNVFADLGAGDTVLAESTPASGASLFADIGADRTENEPALAVAAAPKPARKQSGGKTPWMFAGVAALLVATVAVVIIVIKNKDGSQTKIEAPGGATVTIKEKDGKTLAQVGPGIKPPEIKPPDTVSDPDRQAADYVFSLGGIVRAPGQFRDFKFAAELPNGRFTLGGFDLHDSKVTDAGLAHFKDCKSLVFIHLSNTAVTDAGLAYFKDRKELWFLDLAETAVTNAGLAHFKDCKSLGHLNLRGTNVTDAGLASFKDCKGLGYFNLSNTAVTDAGLAHFQGCKDLGHLDLVGTAVTDAGLAHLQGCTGLVHLFLHNLKVTGAGLASFKDCKNLRFADLGGTKVTDAGLAHLKDCKKLFLLNLAGTAVTDAGLAHVQGCKDLGHLQLDGTAVTDTGLAYFKDCKGLGYLGLYGTKVTDAGLASFQDCKGLAYLNLAGTKVTAKGLAAFHAAVPGCKIDSDGGTIEPKK